MKFCILCLLTLVFWGPLTTRANDKLLNLVPDECNIIVGIDCTKVFEWSIVKESLKSNKALTKDRPPGIQMIKTMLIGVEMASEKVFMTPSQQPHVFVAFELQEPQNMDSVAKTMWPGVKFNKAKFLDKVYYEGEKHGNSFGVYQISETQYIMGTRNLLHKGIMLNKGIGKTISNNRVMKSLLVRDIAAIYAGGFIRESEAYNGFSLLLDYEKGVKLKGRVYCKTTTDAKTLVDELKKLLSVQTTNLQLDLKPEDINISTSKKAVTLVAFIPEATLKQIPTIIVDMIRQQTTTLSAEPAQ